MLELYVQSSDSVTVNATVCQNNLPYSWNGQAYTQEGIYPIHLSNSAGCDSLVVLNLTILPTVKTSEQITICASQLPYLWNNHTYTASGVYPLHFQSIKGCDSIAELDLKVLEPTGSVTTVKICSGDLPFTWNDQNYSPL